MTRSCAVLVAGMVVSAAWGQSSPRSVPFLDLYRAEPPEGCMLAPAERGDGAEQLVIEKATDGEYTYDIAYLDDPGIKASAYAVVGEVRYENVDPPGYLMTWNCFASGKYFSKGIDDHGPGRTLSGDSGWREFELPFYCTPDPRGESPRPYRIELNLVLPGKGAVTIRNVQLVERGSGGFPIQATPSARDTGSEVGSPTARRDDAPVVLGSAGSGQWWSDRSAGLIGGIGGSVLGCMGGLVGALAGLGRARRVAIGTLVLMGVIGVGSLIGGIVALAFSQPYGVYYPLLLGGVLCTVLPLSLFRTLLNRYAEAELRRMNSLDAR